MGKELVSIIIPAYNHEFFIEDTLESAISQTYDNIELIIINDGSTDNTELKINGYNEKLKKRFTNYHYIKKNNEGICKTLNLGVSLAKGKYIQCLASDDIILPYKIENCVNRFENAPNVGVVYSDVYEITWNGKIKDYSLSEMDLISKNFFDLYKIGTGRILNNLLKYVFNVPTASTMIKAECYKVVGNYDENLSMEDPDMFLRIAKIYEYDFIDNPLVVHRVHGKNLGRDSEIMAPNIHKMIAKYRDIEWLSKIQRATLYSTLRSHLPIDMLITMNLGNRKLIIWGTGSSFFKAKDKINADIEFFIDNDPKKTYQILEGKTIYLPTKLHTIDISQYYIAIFSIYKEKISELLLEMGYIKDIDFN